MNKRLYIIIIFVACCFCSEAQHKSSQPCNVCYIIDTISLKESNIKGKGNGLQLLFYPDSLPSEKWLAPKYQKMQIARHPTEQVYPDAPETHIRLTDTIKMAREYYEPLDTTIMINEWVKTVDRNELRVLSLVNASAYPQKYFVCGSPSNLGNVIFQQAKDELGNWREVKCDKVYYSDKRYLEASQGLNVVP